MKLCTVGNFFNVHDCLGYGWRPSDLFMLCVHNSIQKTVPKFHLVEGLIDSFVVVGLH